MKGRILDFLQGKSKYQFTLLQYRPSLTGEEVISLAVVAELPLKNGAVYFILGRDPEEHELEGTSELGRRVLTQLEDWLRSELDDALEASDDPLDHLVKSCPWNLTFSEPRTRKAKEFLSDVVQIFARQVLEVNEEQLVGRSIPRRADTPVSASPSLTRTFSVFETPATAGHQRRVPAYAR